MVSGRWSSPPLVDVRAHERGSVQDRIGDRERFDEVADIADGYHRVSLAYALDPFAAVPLRIASVSSR
jgi:hypothetical protein